MADQTQDTKRRLKKKDELIKTKRNLAGVHKLTLPELHDMLDGGPWVDQVNHMLRALEEQEQRDPLIKQQVLCKIKDSLKASTGQLKVLTKTIEKWHDLERVVERIKKMLENQYVVIEDFQARIRAMKTPRTKQAMMQNCNEIVLNIEYMVKKDMLKHIDPTNYSLLLDKSLSPEDHRAGFDVHLSTVFRRDDKRTVVFPEGLTELEKLA